MTDPRSIGHDKKVHQAKRQHGEEVAPDAQKTPPPGKKTPIQHHVSNRPKLPDEAAPGAAPRQAPAASRWPRTWGRAADA